MNTPEHGRFEHSQLHTSSEALPQSYVRLVGA